VKFLNYISVIIFAVLFTFSAKSQTVIIADYGFRKCMADSIPAVLDADQKLILAEAAKITKLECPNYKITQVEELVHFSSIQVLNLVKNPVISLPDMSGLKSITRLNIGDTRLKTLPDFSSFPELQFLSFHKIDSSVRKFPDLSSNRKLIQLNASGNRYDSIPKLILPELQQLNISLTRQIKLPDLTGMPKLAQLECFRNPITDLPDFTFLTNLKFVDFSDNQINKFPVLPAGISKIYLDKNLIDSLPDLSKYPSLTEVRLNSNFLSFEDFLPLVSLPGFTTNFKISPQKNFPVGVDKTVVEQESFSLNSKINQGIVEVRRTWYRNDTLTSQTGLQYKVGKAGFADQGYYYCKLTHPSVPGLTLQTDSFNVNVLPCVNLAGVNTEVTPGTCLVQGALKVNLSAQPGKSYKYEIAGLKTQKIISSESGVFSHLEDTEYKLTISTPGGCRYSLLSAVVVPREKCSQVVVTPNGDGVDDTYFFEQSGEAKIVDKWGNTVSRLPLPKLWDAYIGDQRIPVGYYLISINEGEEILKLSVIY
jgi:internalin A